MLPVLPKVLGNLDAPPGDGYDLPDSNNDVCVAQLGEAGYAIDWRHVSPHWIGIPHQRNRLVYWGIQEDQGLVNTTT
jgi:hypothetical protein